MRVSMWIVPRRMSSWSVRRAVVARERMEARIVSKAAMVSAVMGRWMGLVLEGGDDGEVSRRDQWRVCWVFCEVP